MSSTHELHSISDDELLRRLSELLKHSRRVESDLVAHIGEVDERRLYAREAASSMFVYCTEVLHLSEHEAYLRITAARASRKYPTLLAMLEDGRIHLSGIGKLAPHLTDANCEAVLLARLTSRNVKSKSWWPSFCPSRMCRQACASSPHGPRSFKEGRASSSFRTE